MKHPGQRGVQLGDFAPGYDESGPLVGIGGAARTLSDMADGGEGATAGLVAQIGESAWRRPREAHRNDGEFLRDPEGVEALVGKAVQS